MNLIRYRLMLILLLLALPCLSYGQGSTTNNDLDNDGILNHQDNCSEKANPNQLDSDNDDFGNVCDADFDNNNIVDNSDYGIFFTKLSQLDMAADLDGDGNIGFGDIAAFDALHGMPPGPGATDEVPVLATVTGRVVDIAGVVVANSTVTPFLDGNPLSAETSVGTNGEFTLALPAEAGLSLAVGSPNYANQVIAVTTPPAGGSVSLTVTLIPRGDTIMVSDDGINTYSGSVGAAVTFDKADFVDENGVGIVGDIQLAITPVDVSKPATLAAFPGSFSGFAEGDAETSEIISLGTVEYHFTQNGNPVNLAPGKTAEVLLPIYVNNYQDGSPVTIGDSIPLWSLNEETGIWLQEGHGEVVASDSSTTGLAMRATVGHFSWWNVDIIAQTAEVEITVLGATEGKATIFGEASSLAWNLATIGVNIGGTTDRLKIPTGTEVCFSAALVYDNGAFSLTDRPCLTASTGEVHEIILTGQAEGELDILTNPIGELSDQLNVYTAVNQPVPISMSPLTAETDVTYTVSAGNLPDGLSVQTVGVNAQIVGTPTLAGSFDFTITATDADGFEDILTFTYFVQDNTNSISLSFAQTEHLGLSIGLFSGSAIINWNDGSAPETIAYDETNTTDGQSGQSYTRVYHEYNSARAGSVTVAFSDGYGAVRVIGSPSSSTAQSTFNFDVFALSALTNLQLIDIDYYSGPITGELSSIPRSVESLYIESFSGSVTGNASDLPHGLVHLRLRGQSGPNGDVAGLPRSLAYIYSYNSGNLTGDISGLPSGLTYFYVSSNTISGNIASLPATPSYFSLSGQNTVTGDVVDIPDGIASFNLYGQNTISGDVADIPDDISNLTLYGQNTLTGDIANIPETIGTFRLAGQNSLTGDIATLAPNLRTLYVSGQNTIHGDIADLSSSMYNFNIQGQNTLYGNVGGLTEGLRFFQVFGSNTISGNISAIPANMFSFHLHGNNTVSGDLGLLQAHGISHLRLGGDNTVDAFSENPTWAPTNLAFLYLHAGGTSAFDATEVDRLLIHLNDNLLKQSYQRTLYIRRTHDAAPTEASSAAIVGLNEKNYNVQTN